MKENKNDSSSYHIGYNHYYYVVKFPLCLLYIVCFTNLTSFSMYCWVYLLLPIYFPCYLIV